MQQVTQNLKTPQLSAYGQVADVLIFRKMKINVLKKWLLSRGIGKPATVLGQSQVAVIISLILLLPLSHNISIEWVQNALVGQLKGIVQNLFAFTTEKYNHNSYTM